MNINDLKWLVQQPESTTLEFKTSMKQLKPAIETLCGFLNGEGGTVLLGVNDRGVLKGQIISDRSKQEIAQELNRIEPQAESEIYYIETDKGNHVVAMRVKPSGHKPHLYDGRAYERNESTTRRLSQHRYEQLLIKRDQLNHSWEDAFAPDYSIAMLDQNAIDQTISDGVRQNRLPASAVHESIEKSLTRLKLYHNGKLKRAAIVLFAKTDSLYYRQCMIKMARFSGVNKLRDFIDSQHVEGHAFKLLEEADNFLRQHLPIASFFAPDQFKRIDVPALPVLAVRCECITCYDENAF